MSKEYEKCKRCGSYLFPWERQSPVCEGCREVEAFRDGAEIVFPRCEKCGKKSLKPLCTKCRKETTWKQNYNVRCSVCGLLSTTTDEKWKSQPYKCNNCR